MTAPSEVAARVAYRDALVELMGRDEQVVCLDTDTGTFAGVDFGAAGERYLNLGIAEHNLMGVGAGIAATGTHRPYLNTFAAFACSRAVEAVKIDIAYNALPVHIVATHAGVSAGHLGPTHHALEDLAVMRALPNMTVVVPGDAAATIALLAQTAALPGPVYLRLGRKPTPALPGPPPVLGRLEVMRPGERVVIVACGPLPTHAALAAAGRLAARGVDAGVLQAHTLKPFDEAGLVRRIEQADLVVAVEEHWRSGGLGSAVAETVAEHSPRRVVRVGLPDQFMSTVGGQEHILATHGVSAAGIVARVSAALSLPLDQAEPGNDQEEEGPP
jgi:transketolase